MAELSNSEKKNTRNLWHLASKYHLAVAQADKEAASEVLDEVLRAPYGTEVDAIRIAEFAAYCSKVSPEHDRQALAEKVVEFVSFALTPVIKERALELNPDGGIIYD